MNTLLSVNTTIVFYLKPFSRSKILHTNIAKSVFMVAPFALILTETLKMAKFAKLIIIIHVIIITIIIIIIIITITITITIK